MICDAHIHRLEPRSGSRFRSPEEDCADSISLQYLMGWEVFPKMSHRILVVDDSDDTCEVMRLYLTSEGFTVIVARDGNEGSEAAVRESPDLIITDARMPNLDGIEMTRQLRAQSRFKQLPIIIVTGYSQERELEAWQAGANEVLIKPVSPDSLVTRMRDLLS